MLYGAQFNSGLWRGGGTDSAAQQDGNETNNMVGKPLSLYDNHNNWYPLFIVTFVVMSPKVTADI